MLNVSTIFICTSWTVRLVFGHLEAHADPIKKEKCVLFFPIAQCKFNNKHSQ